MREPRRGRRLRAMVGLVAGCAVLAGCVSVRPLALVPPDGWPRPRWSWTPAGGRWPPEVLGRPEPAARRLLDQAGLGAEVLAGCDDDPARAAAEPGGCGAPAPAPGAQSPVGGRVRLWVNPGSCPAPTTTTTRAGRATTTTER